MPFDLTLFPRPIRYPVRTNIIVHFLLVSLSPCLSLKSVSKHPGVKKFLYADDGLTVYEKLTFDLQSKGVPTLHLFEKEWMAEVKQGSSDSLHSISLEGFSFAELHKLMALLVSFPFPSFSTVAVF